MRHEARTRQAIDDPRTSIYRTRRAAVRLILPALLGGIALVLLSILTARAAAPPAPAHTLPARLGSVGASAVLTQPLPPPPTLLNVQASSAYTTGGKLYDGTLVTDGDISSGWISDPAPSPLGQWIEWDVPPGAQVAELGLTNYTTAMRYSRPQTTTLTMTAGTSQVLTWTNTSQDQRQALPTPVQGRVRLTVDTVWGGNQQPVGIAEIRLFMAAAQAAPTTTPPSGVALPTIGGPNTTAPTTVPLIPPTPATSPAPPATLPIPTPPQTDPWRWVLIGVLVLLAAVFVVRGMRRQRGP